MLVVNIGGNGNFSIEDGKTNSYFDKKYSNNELNSGDAYIFGKNGLNRDVFHRTVASSIKGNLPSLNIQNQNNNYNLKEGSYRISITLRRVMPLNGIESSPKEFEIINDTVNNKPQQLSLFDKNDDWQNEDNDDTCVPF